LVAVAPPEFFFDRRGMLSFVFDFVGAFQGSECKNLANVVKEKFYGDEHPA
jgi:hypothetical protein